MIMRMYRLKTSLYSTLAIILVGCGGGGGNEVVGASIANDPNSEIINGIAVPRTNGQMDQTSIIGADANVNGVRDDIEKALAGAYGSDKATFQASMRVAMVYQLWIAQPASSRVTARARVLDEIRALNCLHFESNKSWSVVAPIAGDINLRTFGTAERRQIHKTTVRLAGGFTLPAVETKC